MKSSGNLSQQMDEENKNFSFMVVDSNANKYQSQVYRQNAQNARQNLFRRIGNSEAFKGQVMENINKHDEDFQPSLMAQSVNRSWEIEIQTDPTIEDYLLMAGGFGRF